MDSLDPDAARLGSVEVFRGHWGAEGLAIEDNLDGPPPEGGQLKPARSSFLLPSG